jgi:hypothetical protein
VQGLTDALEEEVITRIEEASAEQLALLREIRATVTVNSVSTERIHQLDTAVDHAGRGPMYFNLIVMIYEKRGEEYREYLSSLGSMPSTPDLGVSTPDSGEDMEGGTECAPVGGRVVW